MDAAAAAAATSTSGKITSFGQAVAVSFHDGRVYKLVDGIQNGLKEQLWVLSPSGHLIRYGLRFLTDTEGYTDHAQLQFATAEALDVKMVVEPLQKWDVCRRPSWVEREEKINNSVTPDRCHDAPSCPNLGSRYNKEGSLAKRDDLPSDGVHQLFLSNAEVYMHHFRPPIWAKSQVLVLRELASTNEDAIFYSSLTCMLDPGLFPYFYGQRDIWERSIWG
jgi:hypothetical protein